MKKPQRRTRRREGVAAALFSAWCLFWMVQPACYWPSLAKYKWLGFPAHYLFWLVGMVIVVPLSSFVYTHWANLTQASPHESSLTAGKEA